MSVMTGFIAFLVATAVIYVALSLNGKTDAPAAQGHGNDDHGGHGHH